MTGHDRAEAAVTAVVGDSPLVALVVGAVLLLVTYAVARRLANAERDARLFWLVMVSAGVRFGCCALQVLVVHFAYHGVADYTGYVNHGMRQAAAFRAGNFAPLFGVTSNGTVDTAAGILFTFISDQLIAGFLVFSWLSLMGLLAFYRAFRIAVPEGDGFRYGVLVLLMPSLLYWPSEIGKEALMLLFLGVAAHGAARLLAGYPGAFPRLITGLGLATLLRANEALLMFLGIFAGYLVVGRRRYAPARQLLTVLVLGAAGVGLLVAASHFIHLSSLSASGLSAALRKAHSNNSGVGAGFGSSNYTYSADPLRYPQDVYTVLFDPLPFQVHDLTQLIASVENLVVLGVVLVSLPRLWAAVRQVLRQPYLALAFVYSALFLYFFASLGNLGLLDRERCLLFPLLFALLSIRPPARVAARAPARRLGPVNPVTPLTTVG